MSPTQQELAMAPGCGSSSSWGSPAAEGSVPNPRELMWVRVTPMALLSHQQLSPAPKVMTTVSHLTQTEISALVWVLTPQLAVLSFLAEVGQQNLGRCTREGFRVCGVPVRVNSSWFSLL